MSLHGNFEVSARRKVIMPADDDDEIGDFHSFQDIRMELNATGHNLVSKISPTYFSSSYCNKEL